MTEDWSGEEDNVVVEAALEVPVEDTYTKEDCNPAIEQLKDAEETKDDEEEHSSIGLGPDGAQLLEAQMEVLEEEKGREVTGFLQSLL